MAKIKIIFTIVCLFFCPSFASEPLPLDDLVSPSLACLNRAEPHDGTPRGSELFSGCYSYAGAVSNHWALLRYYGVSIKTHNPSPLPVEIFEKSLALFDENLFAENNFLTYFNVKDPLYSFGWLLRLSIEWSSLRPENDIMLFHLNRMSQMAATYMVRTFKNLSQPVDNGTVENTAFNMWQLLSWAKTNTRHQILDEVNRLSKRFFLNENPCKSEHEINNQNIISPCFAQILLMSDVLDKSTFAKFVQTKTREFMWFKKAPPHSHYSISPMRLLALERVRKTLPANRDWIEAYQNHYRATIAGFVFWKDDLNVSYLVAPMMMLGLTEGQLR